MIDPEREIFDRVGRAVLAEYPNAAISDEFNLSSPAPLSVSIEMSDNYALRSSASTSTSENHAVLMFEVNVVSTKAKGRKAEAKAAMALIDGEFDCIGFTRTAMLPINEDPGTKYRLTARYEAVAGKTNNEFTIYRR